MQTQTSQPQNVRTPYRTPKLVRYGQLASITESGTSVSGIEIATITNSNV